jgi:hypothetical protein
LIISYRLVNGRVEKRIICDGTRPRGDLLPHDRHFSETLLRAYYKLECEEGSRFRSSYTKTQIKRVHDTAMARDGAL